jgi:4-hydroxybenzoate polyprenyltransferase
VAYSLALKRKPLVDIFTLGLLYTFRIAAGSVAMQIALSEWLLAFSAFLFLSLAAVKRQAELIDLQARGRENVAGRGYKVIDLPIVSQMATAAGFMAVLVLMLYINEDTVRLQYSQPSLLWGACLVLLYWVSRMILLTQRGRMHDDPIVFAMRDPVSLGAFGLMTLSVVAASTL